MSPFFLTKGDRRPLFVVTLVDDYGEATEASVNLTTAGSAGFSMFGPSPGTALKITRGSAAVTSAAQGELTYSWTAGDVDTAGTFWADAKIYWADGRAETFPNSKQSGDGGTKYWEIVIDEGTGS